MALTGMMKFPKRLSSTAWEKTGLMWDISIKLNVSMTQILSLELSRDDNHKQIVFRQNWVLSQMPNFLNSKCQKNPILKWQSPSTCPIWVSLIIWGRWSSFYILFPWSLLDFASVAFQAYLIQSVVAICWLHFITPRIVSVFTSTEHTHPRTCF